MSKADRPSTEARQNPLFPEPLTPDEIEALLAEAREIDALFQAPIEFSLRKFREYKTSQSHKS
jgi:hypothetical protein